MKKILLIIIFAFFFSFEIYAQVLSSFKEQLSQPDPTHMSRVKVQEHGTAGTAVLTPETDIITNKIRGYRICIFIDNSQNARVNAQTIISRFMSEFPDIPAYILHESPYFKVTVGNCLSSEEAIILWGRIKGIFDRAFVIRENIALSELCDNQHELLQNENITQ